MNPRIWVTVMAIAVGGYVILAVVRGGAFLGSGDLINVLLGLSVIAVPVIGAWLVWREISFGKRMQVLGQRLAERGDLPVDDFPRTPSGRVELAAAQAWFEEERDRVERDPDDWAGWYRLGLAYDAARDRRRAREAMGQAVRIARQPGGPLA
jgi:cytochrome c-type biogenesis protein CcmH/NrfG